MEISLVCRSDIDPTGWRRFQDRYSVSGAIGNLSHKYREAQFEAEREGLGAWIFLAIRAENVTFLLGAPKDETDAGAAVWTDQPVSAGVLTRVMKELFGASVRVMNSDSGSEI